MADVNRRERPLSPFMFGQYYRPQWGSMTSIVNRITGNALLVTALLVVWWFISAATGPEAFAVADGVITSWFGDLVMFLSLWGLWYHSLAGIRHLIWDTGRMLDIPRSELAGKAIVVLSVALTILTAIVI